MILKQIDAVSKKFLKILYKMGYAQIPNLTANEVRALFSNWNALKQEPNQLTYIEYKGKKIPLHIYLPNSKEINSIILYLHGGGYVIRQFMQSSSICNHLSDKTNSCVILIEYSLAPEDKFPQAILETTSVIDWVINNKLSLSHREDTSIFLCGESSGANLATAALLNRKKTDVEGMILICPSLDYYNQYRSKIEYSTGFLLDEEVRAWFACQYLNSKNERNNPLVSPNLSKDLFVLPKTLIISAYFDPLRDEAEVFHNKLIENGISSDIKQFDTIHGFFSLKIEPYSEIANNIIKNFINHTV